jgi:hypothetical protein
MGWDQVTAANFYNVSYFNYKLAEYDRAEKFEYKPIKLVGLGPNDICILYRKRAKKTQFQVAQEMGIGREWVRLQELGKVPCTKLLAWWESGG